jgi:hypothetical protein
VSLPIRSNRAWFLGPRPFRGRPRDPCRAQAPVAPSPFGLHMTRSSPADYPQRAAVFSGDGDGVKDVLPRERDKPAEFSSTWIRSDMAWTRPTFFLATSCYSFGTRIGLPTEGLLKFRPCGRAWEASPLKNRFPPLQAYNLELLIDSVSRSTPGTLQHVRRLFHEPAGAGRGATHGSGQPAASAHGAYHHDRCLCLVRPRPSSTDKSRWRPTIFSCGPTAPLVASSNSEAEHEREEPDNPRHRRLVSEDNLSGAPVAAYRNATPPRLRPEGRVQARSAIRSPGAELLVGFQGAIVRVLLQCFRDLRQLGRAKYMYFQFLMPIRFVRRVRDRSHVVLLQRGGR